MKLIAAIFIATIFPLALSAQTTQVCTSNCPVDITKQTAGSGATAKHTNSSSSQAGNSTASNASGVTVSPITQSSTGPQTQTQTGTQSASAANNGNTLNGTTGASTSNAKTGDNTNTIGTTGGFSKSGSSVSGVAGGEGGMATGGKASVGKVSGGASTAGASNGAQSLDTGHNSSISNTNVNEKTTFIPSMLPQTPVVQLAGAGIDKEVLACGPRQVVIHQRVTQTMAGLFRDHHIDVGETDDLVPFDGEPYIKVPLDDGRKGYEMYGDQPVMYTTVLGAASGRSIGGGGTTANQASGQLGFGGSSSVQRLVVKIELRRCDLGTVVIEEPKPVDPPIAYMPPPVVYVPPVVDVPAPPIATPVHHHRKHKKAKSMDCTPH